jgi:hypothetical protein
MSNPDSWQTNAPGPAVTIEGSDVAIWVLGAGRFRLTWAGEDQEVEGFVEAQALAHELAETERRGLV